jgi:hypothetical protein
MFCLFLMDQRFHLAKNKSSKFTLLKHAKHAYSTRLKSSKHAKMSILKQSDWLLKFLFFLSIDEQK